MERAEMIAHNQEVVKNVIIALVENNMVDPSRLLLDINYAAENISTYIEAANMAREMMNMPKLFLYNINE